MRRGHRGPRQFRVSLRVAVIVQRHRVCRHGRQDIHPGGRQIDRDRAVIREAREGIGRSGGGDSDDVVQIGQIVEVWVRRVRDDRVELTMIEPLTMEWRELKPDLVVKGKVARLESYGAFVDIGAERPGLVHISEISHNYIKSPAEVLKEGDEVEAKILDVDRRKKQIRLSIKATQPEPEKVPTEVKKSETRRERGKKDIERKSKRNDDYIEAGPKEPEMTSMEIAWREAKTKAEKRKDKAVKIRKAKSDTASEQEEIYNRTLENRITTG